MPAFVGQALLRRLVAQRAKVPLSEVEKVLEAYAEVARVLLNTGAKVRVIEDGHLVMIDTKPTRRHNPATGGIVEVPAKRKIVFRETRKK